MKRIGLAVLISLCGFVVYLLGAAFLLEFVFPNSDMAESVLLAPLSPPHTLLEWFFPPPSGGEIDYPVLALGSVIDIILYAIPIYGVLTLWARIKRPRTLKSTEPPPPPTFDD